MHTSKTVTIHQPQYLPWIPYFSKILESDLFIILDNVAFQKNGVQNRNQIKTPNGKTWLTLPIKHSLGQPIKDTVIANPTIATKHLKTIEQSYKKALFFDEIYSLLSNILQKTFTHLNEINCELLKAFLNYLEYDGEIINASVLNVDGSNSELIRNLCLETNATTYLSGQGGKNYMDMADFEKNNIHVVFHEYTTQPYTQLYPTQGFFDDLSIIDLLFNLGKQSRAHIQKGQNHK